MSENLVTNVGLIYYREVKKFTSSHVIERDKNVSTFFWYEIAGNKILIEHLSMKTTILNI